MGKREKPQPKSREHVIANLLRDDFLSEDEIAEMVAQIAVGDIPIEEDIWGAPERSDGGEAKSGRADLVSGAQSNDGAWPARQLPGYGWLSYTKTGILRSSFPHSPNYATKPFMVMAVRFLVIASRYQ